VNIIPPNLHRPVPSLNRQRPGKTDSVIIKPAATRVERRQIPDRRHHQQNYQYPMDLRKGVDRRQSRRLSITT
jgi:hypothetical protein